MTKWTKFTAEKKSFIAEEKARKEKIKPEERALVSLASFVGKINDSQILPSKTALPSMKNTEKSSLNRQAKKVREVPEGFIKPQFAEKIDSALTSGKVFKLVQETYPLNTQQIFLAEPGPVEYCELLREKSAGVLELKPLSEFVRNAKVTNTPLRQYKPKAGESWDDVLKRAQKFVVHLANFGFRDHVLKLVASIHSCRSGTFSSILRG